MTEQTSPTPPQAVTRPESVVHHGITLTDDFQWLREPDNSEVRELLEAENAYTDAITADQQELRKSIFNEIKSHTVETDQSVPNRVDDWWYFARTFEGKQYPALSRIPAQNTDDAVSDWTPPVIDAETVAEGEQVIFDANIESEGHQFFAQGGQAISPDGNLLAYLVETTGDERFTLRIRDLNTGKDFEDKVEGLSYGVSFDLAGEYVFYMRPDDSWRPYQVFAHKVGTDTSEDVLLFEEPDETLWGGFGISPDKKELFIVVGNSEVQEVRSIMLPESGQNWELKTLVSREREMLVDVAPAVIDGERYYYILHNLTVDGERVPNNMLSLVKATDIADPSQWQTVIEHSSVSKLDSVSATRIHLVVEARVETTPRVLISPLGEFTPTQPNFPEELYSCELVTAPYESPLIRFSYTSWVTPPQVLEYAPATGELMLRKQREVKNYDPADLLVERWWAPAESTDRNVAIPLTVIRHKDTEWDGSNPCVVYGYGSYEISMDPAFSVSRLSLLERGVIYVVAHIRGGGELGRGWYENGKKLAKKNSFTDFVDATRFVAASGWVNPDHIACMGGSAGGLLMGAVINLAPELYRVCVADVPFVDALTSILDPSLPLTALEWEEWGNPIEDAEVFTYMSEYSPYLNVREIKYPAIAAVTSLNDTRVSYSEPTKWVQQLRRTVTNDQTTPLADGGAPIVQKTEMDGGHGGASGRYRAWEDIAWQYAFILTALGATEKKY